MNLKMLNHMRLNNEYNFVITYVRASKHHWTHTKHWSHPKYEKKIAAVLNEFIIIIIRIKKGVLKIVIKKL